MDVGKLSRQAASDTWSAPPPHSAVSTGIWRYSLAEEVENRESRLRQSIQGLQAGRQRKDTSWSIVSENRNGETCELSRRLRSERFLPEGGKRFPPERGGAPR